MIIEFRPAAQLDLLDATAWYLANGGHGVAQRFDQAVRRALNLLAHMPSLGTPAFRDERAWPLKHFPYTLVYRLHGETLTVVAVAHQRRAPAYWQGARPRG